jgi:hypothetical protein
MSEMIDLKKERNFFENRVTKYQTGGALNWEKPLPRGLLWSKSRRELS